MPSGAQNARPDRLRLERGGTAGLADMIGDAFGEAGCETVVCPATGIYDLADCDAVVVVGALHANRWHRDARRFVRRNTAALRELPVWLVSSDPLDESAEHTDIPPTNQIARLANRIGARGHVTLCGSPIMYIGRAPTPRR